jgi:hypothetical protein
MKADRSVSGAMSASLRTVDISAAAGQPAPVDTYNRKEVSL